MLVNCAIQFKPNISRYLLLLMVCDWLCLQLNCSDVEIWLVPMTNTDNDRQTKTQLLQINAVCTGKLYSHQNFIAPITCL